MITSIFLLTSIKADQEFISFRDCFPLAVLMLRLAAAGACAFGATVLSFVCIYLQLKNYRQVYLQRWVVRILVMVPIYAIASFVALLSLRAAAFIDAVRDVYEAFVIYCFFKLLIEYLGGERALILLQHGRPPTKHPFPLSQCLAPVDLSDPYTFLALKRGILQYVYVKPILAALTILLKLAGSYSDGNIAPASAYIYVALLYNISVSLSLYSLAMLWASTHADLRPFRPVSKFLCVKGLIFATFWQGLLISIIVSAIGSDNEYLSIALQDTLLCYEMPAFALMHLYAFSHKDYIPPPSACAARMPFVYALRDSLLGYRDVLADAMDTLQGHGFDYRSFEPPEGRLHNRSLRERRAAGFRHYSHGQGKQWLPPRADSDDFSSSTSIISNLVEDTVVVEFPDTLDADDEALYTESRRLPWGDSNYPSIDAHKEEAQRRLRATEDAFLRGSYVHRRGRRRAVSQHQVSTVTTTDGSTVDYGTMS